MTMTPRLASEVLLRLASKHDDDPEAVEAVTLAVKRLALRPGCSATSVSVASRGPILPNKTGEAYGRPFEAFRPRWLEIENHDHWYVERWYIGDASQPVALLFTGGDFPTAIAGRDLIFVVRNIGDEPEEFHGEMVGYGYKHRWPTMRRPFPPPREDD